MSRSPPFADNFLPLASCRLILRAVDSRKSRLTPSFDPEFATCALRPSTRRVHSEFASDFRFTG